MNIHITQLPTIGLADFMRAYRLQKRNHAIDSGTAKSAGKYAPNKLSLALGQTMGAIDSIESGKRPPSAELIAAWCQVMKKTDWTVPMLLQLVKERERISVSLAVVRQYPELLDKVKELL